MFDSLKKKLSGWFKKKPEEEVEEEDKKEEKVKGEKKDEDVKEEIKKEEKVEEKEEEKVEEKKEEKVEEKKEEKVEEKKEEKVEEKREVVSTEKKVEEEKKEEKVEEKREVVSTEKKVEEEREETEKVEAGERVRKEAEREKKKAKERQKAERKEAKEKKKAEREKKKAERVKEEIIGDVSPEEQDVAALDEEVKEIAEDIKEDKKVVTEEDKIESLEEEVKEAEVELKEDAGEEKGFFFKLKQKLTTSILKQAEFDDIFVDLEVTLLENNVALNVVDKIKEELGKDLVNASIKKKDVEKTIVDSLKRAIDEVLVEANMKEFYEKIDKSLAPYVILFFGINGSGKTTSVAKLAYKLKGKGYSVVLAGADTFRAASIEQLEEHANKLGVPIVKGEYGKDPASVAFDAISYAKKNKIKVVLIDTAGRMYTKSNLMKEMEKIVRVSNPDLKIFVGESITGNDATEQAKMFNETAGIDGIILTKADVDEKAGAILSVSYVTGKPILFLGTGQGYGDFEEFSKESVFKNLGLD